MIIDFRNSSFEISAPSLLEKPKDALPSILILGRTNVGKSTLINALLGQKIAFASKKAGKTKLLNYFRIDGRFFLIDSPGYGSTSYATLSTINFAKMVESYVKDPSSKGLVVLLDLRRDLGEDDLAFLRYLEETGLPILAVLTKADAMNQKERHLAEVRAKEAGLADYLFSDRSPASLEKIRGGIAKLLSQKR